MGNCKRNTFTFFNLIFAVIAILISLVQAWNQLIFLPIIVINTIVGIYQEIKAKRYLDQMTLLHAPQSTVIRNGQQEKIASDDLVEEDIIILKTGNQIVADARIVEGSIFVNESLLTGEADEIEKMLMTNFCQEVLLCQEKPKSFWKKSEKIPTFPN